MRHSRVGRGSTGQCHQMQQGGGMGLAKMLRHTVGVLYYLYVY